MRRQKIILLHLVLFLILIVTLFLTSEAILNYFASGFHDVSLWINLMVFGSIIIFCMITFSCLIFLKQHKALGILITLGNLFWMWIGLKLLYRYHFSSILSTYYTSNWILIVNTIFSILGIYIGFKVYSKKISIGKALTINIVLLLIGILIQIL